MTTHRTDEQEKEPVRFTITVNTDFEGLNSGYLVEPVFQGKAVSAAAFDALKAERDAYRAVLESEGYPDLDDMPAKGIEFCRKLGETAKLADVVGGQKIDELRSRLVRLESEYEQLHAEHVRLESVKESLDAEIEQLQKQLGEKFSGNTPKCEICHGDDRALFYGVCVNCWLQRQIELIDARTSVSRLTAEAEQAKAAVEQLRENNSNLHVRAAEKEYLFTEAHNRWQELVELTGAERHLSTTNSIHRAVCRWIEKAVVDTDAKQSLALRVGEAVKAACQDGVERAVINQADWRIGFDLVDVLALVKAAEAEAEDGDK